MEWFGLIGPLARWELRRLARRGAAARAWLLLAYFSLLVFVAFAAVWLYPWPLRELFAGGWPPFGPAEADAFSGRFTLVILESLLAAVFAATPALAASAVTEERDRHTLPLLLTTQLTDREIVFGKAAARGAFMLAALTGCVPALLLAASIGRVNFEFVAAGLAVAAGAVVLCAAIGVNAACRAPDLRAALLRSYLIAFAVVFASFVPLLTWLSPFGVVSRIHNSYREFRLEVACGAALAEALAAGLLLRSAGRSLRLRDPGAGPLVSDYPLPPRPATPVVLLPAGAPRFALPPLDASNPVLWKERCAGGRTVWAAPTAGKALAAVAAAIAVALLAGGAWVVLSRVAVVFHPDRAEQFEGVPRARDAGGLLLAAASVFAAGRYLLPVAVGLSVAVAGERYRRTLDVLLSTTLDRRGILLAKARARAERGLVFAAVAVAAAGMAFTADGGIRLGASAAALMLAGLALAVALGAWLTVRCATDLRALRFHLPAVALAAGWPAGAWSLLRFEADVSPELLARGMLVAAGSSAVAALALWLLAGRRLERGD